MNITDYSESSVATVSSAPPSRCPAAELSDASAPRWTDEQLIRACVRGDQCAWSVLVQRYRGLIYSFPLRYGASTEDAKDVFQRVCAELFVALPNLRDHQCLRGWLMRVASHQAGQWKRRHKTRMQHELPGTDDSLAVSNDSPSKLVEERERECVIREAIAQLAPPCRVLVRLLFYSDPPVPYATVAAQLGLATGSIGLTRSRCLVKLQRLLTAPGSPYAAEAANDPRLRRR